MPSFSIALTGLKADSIALNTIGNNLANLNTTAFKKQTVSFTDLLYQNIGTSGANTPLQVGVGTKVGSITTDYTQGSLTTTGSSEDMAINGDGFFLVQKDGTQALTRAGNFQLDSPGNLITSTGESVLGYPATDGTVNLNAPLTAISIPTGTTIPANASSNFSMTGVLDSSSTTGTSFSSQIDLYDSLGNKHTTTVTFTKTSDTTWDYSIDMPSGDAGTTSGNTGTLTFDSNGKLVSPTSDVTGIRFSNLSDSASDITMNWSLFDSAGNGLMTQSASTSSINSNTQNGYASGSYTGFTVDTDGVITATFSNGNKQNVGQVAIATVANEQGLTRYGNNLYLTSQASGLASVGVAGTGGRGSIEGSSLEESNVDISTEFSDLIVAQRAFQANAKTVTAFDSVTQDTINMIR